MRPVSSNSVRATFWPLSAFSITTALNVAIGRPPIFACATGNLSPGLRRPGQGRKRVRLHHPAPVASHFRTIPPHANDVGVDEAAAAKTPQITPEGTEHTVPQ